MKKITRAQFLSGFGALALGAVASPLVRRLWEMTLKRQAGARSVRQRSLTLR